MPVKLEEDLSSKENDGEEELFLSSLAYKYATKDEWNGISKPSKKYTNLYLFQSDNHILFGLKKRGFGAGKINGFGGKVEEGETIKQAAIREMKEESNFIIDECTLQGVLLYDYPLKNVTMQVFVYRAESLPNIGTVELRESDEMIPVWIKYPEEIDYTKTWADDEYWLEKLVENKKKFVGWFNFSEDMSRVVRCKVYDVII